MLWNILCKNDGNILSVVKRTAIENSSARRTTQTRLMFVSNFAIGCKNNWGLLKIKKLVD